MGEDLIIQIGFISSQFSMYWFAYTFISGPPDKEKQLTGIYDLVAVLTHKGRSADSGHYVAWVKQENGWSLEYTAFYFVSCSVSDLTNLL